MAGTAISSTPFFKTSLVSSPSHRNLFNPISPFVLNIKKRLLFHCSAKKKISFLDQILDYMEGGPKLRKWYGAPDLLPKDGPVEGDEAEDDYPDEERNAVLVTDGDSEIGQVCECFVPLMNDAF